MKKIKLSKTSWLILSAGVFVFVLIGLGLTRSQQVQEQTTLDESLSMTEMRLEQLQVTHLQQQQIELQERLDDGKIELDEAKDLLRQTVLSVDVADEFFDIAASSDIDIINCSTTDIRTTNVAGVGCSSISIGASITGKSDDLIDFVINLNNGFITGTVETVSMNIQDSSDNDTRSSANLHMIIYSYEGA